MYSTRAYGSMIADKVRMRAYTQALRAAVKPGDVVVDLGTGTGIFALLACQYGAAHVYAIDPNENIRVARKVAQVNGLADRIDFIQDLSTKVSLNEQADVIVSDLRGLLPLLEKHIPALLDARQRLLKPGGILIPWQDILNVCVVEAPDLYKDVSEPWEVNPYNLNLNHARELSMNTLFSGRAKAEQMLTHTSTWGILDYHTLESTDLRGRVTQEIVREGVAHGLMVWFDAELIDGIGFSNAPDCEEHPEVYGSAFFPFLRPVKVSEKDEANIELWAVLVGDDYTWCWNTEIVSSEDTTKASFRQSTFYGTIFSPEDLRKRQSGYVPRLNPEGLIEQFIQNEMNGSNPLQVIAERLLARFPEQFSSLQAAVERVGDSAQKYSG